MKCKICASDTQKVFTKKILNKYDVNYYFCPKCEHLQVQEPVFWLDEAYSDAINAEDTGVLKRNLDNVVSVVSIISSFYNTEKKFLDFAGGYGVFTRLMRDVGLDFVWDDKYAKNLFAKGFEYKETDEIELLTAFEVFEHLVSPMDEIEKMFKICPDVLFSQMLMPLPVPFLWWYYAPSQGQHISFYTKKTLNYIASVFNKKYLGYKEFHLFTDKDITLEDFQNSIINEVSIYAANIPKFKTKIADDMNYIINKKA